MLKRSIFALSLLSTSLLSMNAIAFEFGQPIQTKVPLTNSHSLMAGNLEKEVTLMKFNLSNTEKQRLFNYQPKKHLVSGANNNLPSQVELGMNDVPVLDQGKHGSCVTFAVTAAVDAIIGKGDYVSQLCQLELGSYLEKTSYMPSGWNGSFGPWVIDQMLRFGIINKTNQKTKSCAGVTEYPTRVFIDHGKPMPLTDFKPMSENASAIFYPVYRMNFLQRFDARFQDTDQAELVLTQTKKSLAKGNRVTFGTFIVLSPYCSAGACASFKAKQDTWALTKDIESPPYETGGHEMVITGYDDNAIAVDQQGNKHTGLFTIRNSWGAEVGDAGNYYMTYDYFKKFVGEVQEMIPGSPE